MLKQLTSLLLPVLSLFSLNSFAQQHRLPYILDMVHHNPGEKLTVSGFNDPQLLKEYGFTGQVWNDFTFAHAALTFDTLGNIFPVGTKGRQWVQQAAARVKENIRRTHKAGLQAFYFTDIIVLPKPLVDKYHDEICDENNKISFEKPKTIEIHRLMLEELFHTFPDLDGLIIRTGETYLDNVPYHTGNNPITNGVQSHVKLLQLLREVACEKYNKKIFYRTWSFGGLHENPDEYLAVASQVAPHPNLIFSIKHTKGDYHRTFDFNPTLSLGNHQQMVEVQCQREYEGKGAYPNYIADGVINGFEEYNSSRPQPGLKSLKDLAGNKNFAGIWTWSRGGGWVGPYISNEFWCRLNAFVLSRWAADTTQTEEKVFNSFMSENGIRGNDTTKFRKLCLLSATAVLKGHDSNIPIYNPEWTWWMRDEFLGGNDPNTNARRFDSEGVLFQAFRSYDSAGILQTAVNEKFESAALWDTIAKLAAQIKLNNKKDQHYIKVSSLYGSILFNIIANGWKVMALGFQGDKTGNYNKKEIAAAIHNYDKYWRAFRKLTAENNDCATLYKPYAFVFEAPVYHKQLGMDASVNKYRQLLNN